jgi:glycosyltransferase involved in cell wall biosynthesis
MRVALVYDRLNKIGGAEVILTQLAKLYPEADWHTSFWDPTRAPFSKDWKVHTSWLNKIPLLRTRHEWLPWLMPFVFESFDFSNYDLVISVGSAEAKGIITRPGTHHLHYCLTPTRYLYSHKSTYLTNKLYRFIAHWLRKWDQIAATRPDKMIAISTQVKNRIQKYYNRESEIIYPPVDTAKFARPAPYIPPYQDYFLTVARLVAYKNIDLLIKAFNHNHKTLVIVGDGAEREALAKLAGPTVHLVGAVTDNELIGYYQHCRAFVHAGEEDFGIAMCEAQAGGKPVIAYAAGGALDIVASPKVGILVNEPTLAGFAQALAKFDTMSYVVSDCRENAARFDQKVWRRQFKQRIQSL